MQRSHVTSTRLRASPPSYFKFVYEINVSLYKWFISSLRACVRARVFVCACVIVCVHAYVLAPVLGSQAGAYAASPYLDVTDRDHPESTSPPKWENIDLLQSAFYTTRERTEYWVVVLFYSTRLHIGLSPVQLSVITCKLQSICRSMNLWSNWATPIFVLGYCVHSK